MSTRRKHQTNSDLPIDLAEMPQQPPSKLSPTAKEDAPQQRLTNEMPECAGPPLSLLTILPAFSGCANTLSRLTGP